MTNPIANLLWFVLGGFIVLLLYIFGGVLLCITIIGIPFGFQCFKLAGLAAMPFGKEIVETNPPPGAIRMLMNIIWIILPGLELAVIHLILAGILGITIVGIPFAKQHLKMVRLAFIPFGYRAVSVDLIR